MNHDWNEEHGMHGQVTCKRCGAISPHPDEMATLLDEIAAFAFALIEKLRSSTFGECKGRRAPIEAPKVDPSKPIDVIVQSFPRTLDHEQMGRRRALWTLVVGEDFRLVADVGGNDRLAVKCVAADPGDGTNASYVVFQWGKDYGPEPRPLPTPPDTPFRWAWCARDAGNDPAELLRAAAGLVRRDQ